MIKHYCDICNKKIESSSDMVKMNLTGYYPNKSYCERWDVYKELCDSCYAKISSFIQSIDK